MRLAFMGTPDFAAVTLRALHGAGHEILCAYSQPPRPAGRGYDLRPSPVHALAESLGIEVRTPVSLKPAGEQERFAALGADAAVVVAYGLILPKAILDTPRHGCFNVHASLLPRWRGAAPIQRAIMAGDTETGVTIMRMDEGLDTGPMMERVTCTITDATTAGGLHDVLARLGADAMLRVLAAPGNPGEPQPADGVSYASKISKAEARINFTRPAPVVLRHIHGLSPYPGAWCEINGTRLKLLECRLANAEGEPGMVLDEQLTIACGGGAIQVLLAQREGKAPMATEALLRGFPVAAGSRVT
jgi:methionyl-tRNA formyltransferase